VTILGISGSLRRGSYNTALLRALRERLPPGASLEIRTCGDLPLYDAGREGEERPDAVLRLRRDIEAADAVVFATPEYNHGVPGVLQNAIDWASRPAFASPLAHRPAGILSASTSPVGGARAQAALRLVLASTLTPVFPHVDMLVGSARDKFGPEGELTDPKTAERLERYAAGFVAWAAKLRRD